MAIEIRRTPVLEGDAAQTFLISIQKNYDKKVSEQKVRIALEKSKKILAAFKSRYVRLGVVAKFAGKASVHRFWTSLNQCVLSKMQINAGSSL